MEYGYFDRKTGGFAIDTPRTPTPWKMPLFNDNYVTFIDQLLCGKGSVLVPKKYGSKVINPGDRKFWLKDRKSGEIWCLNDSKAESDYKLTHYLNRVELERSIGDIKVNICIFVPIEGRREYWKVSISNNSNRIREVSLFSHIGFVEYSGMGGTCKHIGNAIVKYTFPHHVFYEDKEKCEKFDEYYYMLTDVTPDSCDMGAYNFWNGYLKDDIPIAVINDSCSNTEGEAEDFCGAMQHIAVLNSYETKTICFAIGVESQQKKISNFDRDFNIDFIENELLKSKEYWKSISEICTVNTPDSDLNIFVNLWIKKQIVYLTRTNRMGTICPIRNQLQDAMGYSLFEPQKAKDFMYDVFSTQRSNGYIKQWHTTNGAPLAGIALLEHCDGPIWVVVCGCILVNQIGDADVLNNIIPFSDSGEATLLEHMIKALRYISKDVGQHGICLMHDGDWTDPINGIGRKGSGESAWASMGVMYAAKLLKELLNNIGDTCYIDEVTEIWESIDKAVNSVLWQDDRYIGGFDDDSKPFADRDDNNRIMLNVQTWALLSGAARGEKREIIKKTIKKISGKLGPYTIYPGFDNWDSRWGRISLKKNGTTENGAVYCHAAMFKAFSDGVLGDADAMLDTLLRVTPFNSDNQIRSNRQLPLFIPNYYYSFENSVNYGRSSCNYETGSAAWFLMTVMEELFGVKSTVNGIVLEPNIPEKWDNISCTRKYRNSVYNIVFKRSFNKILVNGKTFNEKVLPYEDNMVYNIIYGLS